MAGCWGRGGEGDALDACCSSWYRIHAPGLCVLDAKSGAVGSCVFLLIGTEAVTEVVAAATLLWSVSRSLYQAYMRDVVPYVRACACPFRLACRGRVGCFPLPPKTIYCPTHVPIS